MTLHDEPPVVDLDDILRDQEEQESARVTPVQWALVIGGGILGVAGLLITLVVVAPAVLELVSWITSIQKAVNS